MSLAPTPRSGRRTFLAALGGGALGLAATGIGPVAHAAAPGRAARATRAEVRPGAWEEPTAVKRALRGVWIASVANIDWPSAPGLPAERQRAEFTALLDRAVAINLNAVFVQIRPTADAFWPSPFEPWSQWLTGTQGQDPGWDPLEFMVGAAHERGLALHAWFNPYRVSTQPDATRLAPGHPARRHPDWTAVHNGGLYYNPGVPAARAFVQQAMLDAVIRYEIDGVHFDDYFYPYPAAGQEFPDDAAFAAYGRDFEHRADWRRYNVDLMVRQMSDLIRAARPEAAFGISPFGVWRNASTDPAGSATAAFESYDGLYADSRGWVRRGWLDYVAPQLYWHLGHPSADYGTLAHWWAAQTAGTDTQLWVGQASYRAGAAGQAAAWQDPAELSRHLTLNAGLTTTAGLPAVGGDILFSARDLAADRIGSISRLAADHWQRPVLGPLLPRLSAGAGPGTPQVRAQGSELVIAPGPDGPPPFQYAVYRYAGDPGPLPPADPALLATLLPAATADRYRDADPGEDLRYAVTAVDRAGRESAPSPVVGPL
ncbi:glycoside hydrolase family 10 protein [Kitasatospora sp. NPDC050543]|uniref:glycoside hydrolase family 10 protein n=1 Tax=Kitasatospora sp. NPDC050543 TaxID=3364054 RepID=UPI00379DC628